jgi:hypothetical protein
MTDPAGCRTSASRARTREGAVLCNALMRVPGGSRTSLTSSTRSGPAPEGCTPQSRRVRLGLTAKLQHPIGPRVAQLLAPSAWRSLSLEGQPQDARVRLGGELRHNQDLSNVRPLEYQHE